MSIEQSRALLIVAILFAPVALGFAARLIDGLKRRVACRSAPRS